VKETFFLLILRDVCMCVGWIVEKVYVCFLSVCSESDFPACETFIHLKENKCV
jgi:hypothetical protein